MQDKQASDQQPQDPKTLSHLNSQGEAQMVDVSAKAITSREAIAEGKVVMSLATLEAIETGNAPKGDVLGLSLIHI